MSAPPFPIDRTGIRPERPYAAKGTHNYTV